MDTEPQPSKKNELEESYLPRPSLYNAGVVGLQSAGFGVLVSAVQNALATHNHGAMGIVSRSGGTIGFFGAMGATFAFADSVSANVREKEDALNGFIGGCAAGALAGLRARSIPQAVLACGVMGGLVATFDEAGRSFAGEKESPEDRETRRSRFFKKPPPFLNQAAPKEEAEQP